MLDRNNVLHMGILFSLIFLGIALSAVVVPIAGGLGAWSWANQKRSGQPVKSGRVTMAALLPFLLVGLALVAYFPLWMSRSANGDESMGDLWKAPIGNHYSFLMIDTTDQGHIEREDSPGTASVEGIRRLASAGDLIVGQSDRSGAFVFDTRSGQLTTYPDMSAAQERFSPRPELKTPQAFWYQHRKKHSSSLATLFFGLPALALCVYWYKRFVRAPELKRC